MSQPVPAQWSEKTHYNLRLSWLHNRPSQALLEAEADFKKEFGKEVSFEIQDYPGWWLHSHVVLYLASGTLEQTFTDAMTILKTSDLSAEDVPGQGSLKAPAELSGEQRKAFFMQLVQPLSDVGEAERVIHKAFLSVGDYALYGLVERLLIRPEFKTTFSDAANPLRSLIGATCMAYTMPIDNEENLMAVLERGEEVELDGEQKTLDVQLGNGVLSLEGNILRVGEWHYEVAADEVVYGTAFLCAFIDWPEQGVTLHIYRQDLETEDEE
jgi:hypothetical protein